MKQKHYIAGLYYRLSQEDERQGESVSIDNQRTILRKYAEEHGFEIHDEYIDDGVSGTTFQRPEVQRLLDDAKTGVINTIIVKDLSRFGRNYIEVGQYVDYVFPAFGIRFIAIPPFFISLIQKSSFAKSLSSVWIPSSILLLILRSMFSCSFLLPSLS